MGKVYLIGGGPGDEELITLKGIRALGKCTAVLQDRLASNGLLKYIREDCKVYYCGKGPGCHYKTQDEINDLLVSLAAEGHTVGRIKGGDPYVFGRGGEEALRLYEEGIEFEVIPGITSPISVLNYAGIPITYRKIVQGFHVFTGKSADRLNINWKSAASIGGTLVFLMGLENLDHITSNLISNGMSKDTPCGVIMRGTTSRQRKAIGTLENIVDKVSSEGFKSPCVIIVGKVVDFNESLSWYDKKVFHGMNVCVTRSKEQAGEIRERLLDLGAEVTEINTIRVIKTSYKLDSYIDKLPDYDFIVMTSVNGVEAFFSRLAYLNYDIRNIKAGFASIGPATADAIKRRGIVPEIIADNFVAEDLFEKMKDHIKKGDKVLLPRSKNARPYLKKALASEGCIVDEVFTYEVVEGDLLGEDAFDDVDIALFTSPSTVNNLISMVGLEKVRKKHSIAIGPITAKELQGHGITPDVCDKYTIDGIIDKLIEIRGGQNVCKK